jgi:protein-disulfide isomerase
MSELRAKIRRDGCPFAILPVAVLFLGFILCAAVGTGLAQSAPSNKEAAAKSEPLAEVNGKAITAGEIERALGQQLVKLEEQIYNLKRQRLEAMINEKLLADEAAKRGVKVQTLLDTEVTSKVTLVTEEEIETFYQQNKANLRGEETEVREQIRARLQSQKLAAQREKFLQSLRSGGKVVVHLKPPPVFRVEVAVDGFPFQGAAKAPVTIVEFSDFHCPYCKRVQPTIAQILAKYGDKVKLVYRHYPIDSLHPGARKAAEAAQCANEQGKFWPYHDKLYAGGTDVSSGTLKVFAEEAKLDVSAFDACLTSRKYQAAVQKDVEEAARLGVTGTPAFFINGRLISGSQPLETFARVIEDELTRASVR